jgi:hypothetical protein
MHANYHHDDQKRDDEGRSESVQGARRYGHHPPECGNDRSGTHAIASADRAAVMNLVRVSTSWSRAFGRGVIRQRRLRVDVQHKVEFLQAYGLKIAQS